MFGHRLHTAAKAAGEESHRAILTLNETGFCVVADFPFDPLRGDGRRRDDAFGGPGRARVKRLPLARPRSGVKALASARGQFFERPRVG